MVLSTFVTAMISPMVPVQKTSSARWISASGMSRISSGKLCSAHILMRVSRVMPVGQALVVEVRMVLSLTRKTWVALVSARFPSVSNMRASSAPASLASSLARMEVSWFDEWMCWSRTFANGRRCFAVMRVRPDWS